MSQENVEIVNRVAAAVTERDIEALLELTDPAVEWESALGVIAEAGVYRGHEGLRQYIRDLEDAFEVFAATIEGTLAIGDVAVAVGSVRAKGSASGIDQVEPLGWTAHFREGKVVYMRAFRDPEQVLGAVGQAE